jgi:aspartyl-tRNA synthetase
MDVAEGMVRRVFKAVADVDLPDPLPRMTYAEAIRRFGSDKPDLRFGLEMDDCSDAVRGSDFKVFSSVLETPEGVVKVLRVPDGKRVSNARCKPKGDISKRATDAGAGGLVVARVGADGTLEAAKPVVEGLADGRWETIRAQIGATEGDLLLFAAGSPSVVNAALDKVRLFLGSELGEIREGEHACLWVTHFPMFEKGEDGRLTALHHPFTLPREPEGDLAMSNAHAFDLVYNGVEVGGGSLRIHNPTLQRRVFDALGITPEEAQDKFGFLLRALASGAPPHGGLALGVDRLCMLLAQARYGLSAATSIRDVIAFPKTAQAECLLAGAPSPVDEALLADVGLALCPTPAVAAETE